LNKIDLLSLTINEIEDLVEKNGEKRYRGRQIFQWLHKGVKDFNEINNIPKKLKEDLKEISYISKLTIEKKLVSNIDGTQKYLLKLEDNNIIEAVTMSYKHGITICISSQIGCLMGCNFCASTIGGLVRNLRAGEMVDQIILIEKDLGKRISNIVIMGSGEPLHNYDEVINFLKVVNHENGLNIGNRHITLSTCGLVPKIIELANLQIPINLAISLHAPDDTLRRSMMPIANKYSIDELMEACKYYIEKNNRRITFEYALIKDVNDREIHAHQLSKLLDGMLCHVNLIPINEVDERQYEKSNKDRIKNFQSILKKNGIEATIRREMGSDINAACGQLRNNYIEQTRL